MTLSVRALKRQFITIGMQALQKKASERGFSYAG